MTWRRELPALYAPTTVLCVLLLIVWLLSYWRSDAVGLRLGRLYAGVTTLNGQARFDWEFGPLATPTRWESAPVRYNGNLYWRQLAPGGPFAFATGTDYRRPPAPVALAPWRVPPGAPAPPPPPPPAPPTVDRWAVVPLWLPPIVALLATPLWAFARTRWQCRRQRRRKPGTCPACGYDLRAGHDRCPECGRPVDVAALMKAVLRG